MSKSPRPLPPRMETFCRLMAQGNLTATDAFLKAGYSEKHANSGSNQVMGRAVVKARIAELQAKTAAKFELTAEWCVNQFLKILDDPTSGGGVKVRTMENLSKIAGAFEKDNRQKLVINPEDAARKLQAICEKLEDLEKKDSE